MIVKANHHVTGMQRFHQNILKKRLGGFRRHRLVKMAVSHQLDAVTLKELCLLLQGREHLHASPFGKHARGWQVKSVGAWYKPLRTGCGYGAAHQRLMPQMHAVKRAQAYRCFAVKCRHVLKPDQTHLSRTLLSLSRWRWRPASAAFFPCRANTEQSHH